MKKCLAIFVLALIGLSISLSAAETRYFNISSNNQDTRLTNSTDYECRIHYTLSDLGLITVNTKGGVFDEISVAGYGYTNRLGEPKLPVLSKIIAVPVGATVSYDLISSQQKTYNKSEIGLQNRIVPAQRSVSKSEDPANVAFEIKQSVYSRNALNDNAMFTVSEIGYMRGVRLFRIEFEPVRYNPISGELQINYDVQIKVNFMNPDVSATQELLAKTASYEFNQLYSKNIFNWEGFDRHVIVRYPTKMLILTPVNYVTTLQPFVDWKRQQGFNVIVTTVGTGGTVTNTSAAIKTYMSSIWSAATTENPAPTYLLIVGDTSTSGDNITASAATVSSPASNHITDNYYVRLNGTDYIPEMYYGRFSVSSATELTNIINKTLQFEKTTMPDLSYLGNVILMAGVDATYAPTYGNGQINYGTTYYFNPTNGITSNTYLYPASNGAVESEIIGYMSAGRGFINYTAHGSETSWADPTVTTTNLGSLTNTNMPFVAVGNCCVTNAFNYSSPCFGEAMIRGANKGGVAYIGATNNSYWDEDYWWGIGYKTPIQTAAHAYNAGTLGAYDAMFHTHSEAVTDWAQTIGETNYIGSLAVEQSTSAMKPYYWEIYSIMGDPSLMPYYGVPTVNTATYPPSIFIGVTSVTVTATPQSRVAITQGGIIYGTGIVDATGSLTLTITPFTSTGTADIVITCQNKITRISTITIVPNSGPYMTLDSWSYVDSNNSSPESGEAGRINATFKNIGTVTATNVSCTLSSTNAGITFTDNTETITSLAAGASVTVTSAFAFNIVNNMTDQTQPPFSLAMVSGTDNWNSLFTVTVNAPALSFGSLTITDPSPGNSNGRLDPGETVTVTMPLLNTGHAASLTGSGTLTSPTSGITINTGTANFSAIAASGSSNLTFNLTASSSMTIGAVASLVFNATAGAYTANQTETMAIGLITETFETGNYSSFPWTQSTIPWTIDNLNYHAGTYSAKSGTITASGSTTLQTTRILSAGGNVTFFYKVSSEATYDFLKFYVDGVVQGSWSGTLDWTQASYALTAGTRTLKWEYMKDGSIDTGSDCAWVDDIVFPASTAPSSFYPPQTLTATAGNATISLNWLAPSSGTPTGYKIFKNGTLLTSVTALTYTDTAVSNGTTYNYYLTAVYSGGESEPTSTVTATPTNSVFANIGTGTLVTSGTQNSPINVVNNSVHGQMVYTAAEMNSAGITGPVLITGMGFYVVTAPSLALPSFVVRIKHTTATNAASWHPADNLVTAYSNASYMPTAGGYDMLIFSTPFQWNGTDNILIDTAFSLVSNASSTGTLQYTNTDNGYCFVWSNSIDQTNVFSGGLVRTRRPNVRLALVTTRPAITVSTPSVAFGSVRIGASSVQQFSIQNTGTALLTGSISAPTGYTVAAAVRESNQDGFVSKPKMDSRDALSFSINAGQNNMYNLTFAPLAVQSYNGNVVIASNDPVTPSFNLAVTGTGYAPPTATLNLTSLETTVNPGESLTSGFTICNTGSQNLNYTTVISGTPTWISCSPVSGTVNPSVCYTVDVQFNASALSEGDYNTSITVNSNDPDRPSQNIAVTLHVAHVNHPPVLSLPASISFNKNEVYNADFSTYVSDADADPLTLDYVPVRDINVQISGLQATFSPANNWYGSTIITFTICDGLATVSDDVTIEVLPTDIPTWTPITYPNNPATVYGVVTIEGFAAANNDQISAFVGTECRGTGTVVINSGQAYTTMLVNLASTGETVQFKVYDTSADLIYVASPSQVLAYGQVLGETTAYPISVGTAMSIAAPVISIATHEGGFRISWAAVNNANRYRVISKSAYDAPDSLVYDVTTTYYDDIVAALQRFFKVIAVHDNAARGGVK